MLYFPDNFAENKGPSRTYFFDILNTLYPKYLAQIMSHANKQRHMATGEAMADQQIKITESWQEQLQSMPYLSRKSRPTLLSLTLLFLLQVSQARPFTSLRPAPSQSREARRGRRSLSWEAFRTSRLSSPRPWAARRTSSLPPRSWPRPRPRRSRRSRKVKCVTELILNVNSFT